MDALTIFSKLHESVAVFISKQNLVNPEFFLVGPYLVIISDYNSEYGNTFVTLFKCSPYILKANNDPCIINSRVYERGGEGNRFQDILDHCGNPPYKAVNLDYLKVYFTELTPEIVEYFRAQKLYNYKGIQNDVSPR